MLDLLRTKISSSRPRVWVVGDIMLDRSVFGTVSRISPEAPVPVLLRSDVQENLGGAANVARDLVALGAEVAIGGVVGTDTDGGRVLGLLADEGIRHEGLLRRANAVTTVKERALAGGQQLLRIDREEQRIVGNVEVDTIVAGLAADLPGPDVILISDYNKGVVSRALVDAVLARRGSAPVFVDPKVGDLSRYAGAQLITPNVREAALATGVEIRDGLSLRTALQSLQQQLPGTDVLITRGPQGLALLTVAGQVFESPSIARRVFDVTGAGDVAIAMLAMARAWGLDWPDALRLTNIAAGIAVGKVGAVPVPISELLAAVSHRRSQLKQVDRGALPELRRRASLAGHRIVFTNGCFDLLHAGHLRLLEGARELGDLLVVAINDDASVRRLKGAERPFMVEEDRAALLAGLEAVDFVCVYPEDTPLETLQALHPDVLVKGGDYTIDQIVGADLVRGNGGSVVTLPLVPGRSTTRLSGALRHTGSPEP